MSVSGLDTDLLKWLDAKFEGLSAKIDESDRRASGSRRDVYKKLEEQGRSILESQHQIEVTQKDVAQLKSSMEAAQPTLEEFTDMKKSVVTARKIGRFFWVVGGGVLFAAAWLVSKWDALAAAFKAFQGK